MNCPSRTDESLEDQGWNQNPPALTGDLTTRQDLHGLANSRYQHRSSNPEAPRNFVSDEPPDQKPHKIESLFRPAGANSREGCGPLEMTPKPFQGRGILSKLNSSSTVAGFFNRTNVTKMGRRACQVLLKFSKFVGPGFMVSVAYIDPGNYSTDVAAGASTRFQLLFIVLMSNIFAIVLQSLAVRLGTVTGMNLAEHCRAHLPWWLNIFLYIMAEAAIIATDIAEVIGSAIALNLLLKIPIVAGCALTLVDVLLILFFYNPNGSMRGLRAFEFCVVALVLGVVVCFCIQLSLIADTPIGDVLKGYLPSSAIVQNQGIYLSCGILGATVMPHSLYLGSSLVIPRLHDFDTSNTTDSSCNDNAWRDTQAPGEKSPNPRPAGPVKGTFTYNLTCDCTDNTSRNTRYQKSKCKHCAGDRSKR